MFNYDSLPGLTGGYDAVTALVNLRGGARVGSNVLMAEDVTNVPTDCTVGYINEIGDASDTAFIDELNVAVYFRVDDRAAKRLSVWSDNACSVPINVNVAQDESADRVAYLQLVSDGDSAYNGIASGWSGYDQDTGAVTATEFFFNVDSETLLDSAAHPLIHRSLNSAVPGRFVLSQRNGVSVAGHDSQLAADLASTGPTLLPEILLLGALLLASGAFMRVRSSRRTTA